jgi:TolA-binding protein
LNFSNAMICVSCGVNLAQFHEAAERLRQRQAEQSAAQLEKATEVAAASVDDAVARAKQKTKRQVLVVIAAAVLVAVAIIIGSALYQQHLRDEYNTAVKCLTDHDYLCARDKLAGLLQIAPNYLEAKANLAEARHGLAVQLLQSKQWQAAIDELNTVLSESPNSRANVLREEAYERWFEDALSHGDLLTALYVRLQMSARPGR